MQFEARTRLATKLYTSTAQEQTSDATKKCADYVNYIKCLDTISGPK